MKKKIVKMLLIISLAIGILICLTYWNDSRKNNTLINYNFEKDRSPQEMPGPDIKLIGEGESVTISTCEQPRELIWIKDFKAIDDANDKMLIRYKLVLTSSRNKLVSKMNLYSNQPWDLETQSEIVCFEYRANDDLCAKHEIHISSTRQS